MEEEELEEKIPPTLANRVIQFLRTSVEKVVFFFEALYHMPFHGVDRLLHSCKTSSRTVLEVQENDLELEDRNCPKSEISEDDHMEEIKLVGPLMREEVSRQVSLRIGNDSGPSNRDPFKRGFFSGGNGMPLLANYFTAFGNVNREKKLFEGGTDDEDDEIEEQVQSAEEPQNTTTGGLTNQKVPQRIQKRRAAARELDLNLAVTEDGHSDFAPIETGLLSSMWQVLKSHFYYYRYGYESEYYADGAANTAPATEPVDPGAGPSSAPEFVPTTVRHYDLVDSQKVKKDARFQKRFYKRNNAETGERTAGGGEEVVTCSSISAQEPPTTENQNCGRSDLEIGESQVQADCKSANDIFAQEYREVQGSIVEKNVQCPAAVMFTEPGICPQVIIDIPSPDKLYQIKDNITWNAQSVQALDLRTVATKIVMPEGEVSYTAQEPMKTEHASAASAMQMSGELATALPLEGLALQLSEILLKSPKKLQQSATHDKSSKKTSSIESIFVLKTESEALLTPTKSKAMGIPTIVITEPFPESQPTIKNLTPKQKYKQEQVLKRDVVASPTKRDHQEHSPTSHAQSECSPVKIPKIENARIILEHIKPLSMESENSSDDTIEYCMENIDFDTKSESTDHCEGDLHQREKTSLNFD